VAPNLLAELLDSVYVADLRKDEARVELQRPLVS
jgi:hypothetical protein